MMRVAILTNGLTYGGAEAQTVHLATGLAERGHEVRLVSILPTRAHASSLAAHGIPVAHVRLDGRVPASVAAIRDGVRALRDWTPDALVSFVYQSNIMGRVAGRLAGVPVIVSSIRNESFGGRTRERLMRLTDPLATITTTNSAGVAAAMVDRGVVPRGRIRVVPNAVDTDRFTPGDDEARAEARRRLEQPEERFCWLGVGRLEPQKAWADAITALAGLPAGQHLSIVGEGPDRPALQAQVAAQGLGDRVRLLGHRADVDHLLRGADGLVLSSHWEGLPNVVAEAMASALPVVATDVGGVRELISDPELGVVVPTHDVDALRRGMAQVAAADPADRATMGKRAREAIVAGFGRAEVLDRWETLLRELVGG